MFVYIVDINIHLKLIAKGSCNCSKSEFNRVSTNRYSNIKGDSQSVISLLCGQSCSKKRKTVDNCWTVKYLKSALTPTSVWILVHPLHASRTSPSNVRHITTDGDYGDLHGCCYFKYFKAMLCSISPSRPHSTLSNYAASRQDEPLCCVF
jgi:hypothetical protein